MKTTHELAAELLALRDVPVVVEGWTYDREPKAVMTVYEPESKAIIVSVASESS